MIVADIQRFSIHDGPGVRTTVFLKGCPLRCRWCHNPETHSPARQVRVTKSRCVFCGGCVAVCPKGCHELTETAHILHCHDCIRCGKCVEICPVGAITWCGKEMTPEEIVKEALKDEVFYGDLGGITLSGGEPLLHGGETIATLRLAKEAGLNTCVETCGEFDPKYVDDLCRYADHIFWDVKLLGGEKHKEWCGVDNALILSNLTAAAKQRPDIIARTLMIKGVTDNEEHVREIAGFARRIGLENPIVLLAFHPYGSSKGEEVGLDYQYMGKEYVPDDETLEQMRALAQTL